MKRPGTGEEKSEGFDNGFCPGATGFRCGTGTSETQGKSRRLCEHLNNEKGAGTVTACDGLGAPKRWAFAPADEDDMKKAKVSWK